MSVIVMAADVNVKFKIKHEVPYGKVVALVGEGALGQWKADGGLAMSWSDGHVWTAECQLPAGKTLEYKYLMRPSKGPVRDQVWSQGNNRRITPPVDADSIEMFDNWHSGIGQLRVTKAAAPPAPLPPPAAPEAPDVPPETVPPAAPSSTAASAVGADTAEAAQEREPAAAVALGEATDVAPPTGQPASSSSTAAGGTPDGAGGSGRIANNIVQRGATSLGGPASTVPPVPPTASRAGWPKNGLAEGGDRAGHQVAGLVQDGADDVAAAAAPPPPRKDQAKYHTSVTPQKKWPKKEAKDVMPAPSSEVITNSADAVPTAVPPAVPSAASPPAAAPAAVTPAADAPAATPPAPPAAAENEPKRLEKWTLSELKNELAARGLPRRGKRHELVARLQGAGYKF